MTEAGFAIAAVAGVLAAVNPCGFVLLPAYLSFLVVSESATGAARTARPRLLARALGTTAAMTSGFVAVFAAFGLVVTPLALSVERYLPWVTLLIGAGLAVLGGWLLAGRELSLLTPKPALGRPSRTLRWAAAYGISYAIASLSCAVAPFLALTTAVLRSGNVVGTVGVVAAYAFGMGLVVGILSVSTALARDAVAAALRRALPYVNRAGGALLLGAGVYVVYYGWYELRVLSGAGARDPVVGTTTRIQGALASWLDDLGLTPLIALFLLVVAAAAAYALLRARRTRPRRPDSAPAGREQADSSE